MNFDNPRLLLFLTLLLPLGLVMALRYRKRRKEAGLFAAAAPAEERNAIIKKYHSRIFYSDFFFMLFLGFCLIALAGPRWGEEITRDYRRGVDVVFAMDVSRSMNVRDCPPAAGGLDQSSRLERAFAIAGELGLGMEGMRIGTAVGKGRGVLALPLSYDIEALMNFLDGSGTVSITGGGTNLESLIDAAAGAFKDNMPGRRGIILFSDGEALSGSVEAALNRAREKEIIVCVAGVGSDEGGTIPVDEGMLLSEDGVPVISARKRESLVNLAEKSGGVYADGNSPGASSELSGFFRSLSSDSGQPNGRRESKPRSYFFTAASILSLGLSRLLGFKRRKKKAAVLAKEKKPLFTLFFVLPFFLSSCVPAGGKLFVMEGNFFHNRGAYTEAVSSYLKALDFPDSSPYAEYGLGSSYFSLEESDAALERYKAAEENLDLLPQERHAELRFRLKYNSGIIYFDRGDFERAAMAFREALEIDGSRIEAKRNLELSLLSLTAVSSPPQASSHDAPEKQGENSGADVLFDFLREREREQWKSREWTGPEDFSGPDY